MPTTIPITDPTDPRTTLYRDVRERDLVGRKGLFVAEGEVVLRVLARQTRYEILSVMLADKRVAALAPLLDSLPESVPVYAATQEALDRIAGFHLHRGILAIGRRPPGPAAGDFLSGLGERALVVGLFGIANHDNMGGIFRNAAAFGADAVLLDSDCCDPLYRKAIRVSVGGVLKVPFVRLERDDDMLDRLAAAGIAPIALSPRGKATLSELQRPPRAAILFGTEGPGLPPEVLTRTTTIRIAMASGFDSLNVATTSGIVLHHLTTN